jgi:hypothetical protein
MNRVLLAAAVWAFGLAGPVFAADAQAAGACPARAPEDDAGAYTPKAQSYCEVRWTDLTAAHKTGHRTHDGFINACAQKCVGQKYGAKSGGTLALVGLGLAGAGGAAAAAGGHGGGSSDPPASP